MRFHDAEYPMGAVLNEICEELGIPDDTDGIPFRLFRFGSCHGEWRETPETIEVLAVMNDDPGNGHFRKLMMHLRGRCRAAGKVLKFRKMMNDRLTAHLVSRWSFTVDGEDCVWKP